MLVTTLLTLVLLSLLIIVHELGHFLIAKLFRVRVDEFGIGLPPKARTLFRKGETEYTLNWLPLGGFVRLAGEEHDPSLWEKLNPVVRSRMFFAKPAWQRALILLSGVTVNFLVGILCFSFVYAWLGVPKEAGSQVIVTQVVKDSPAAQAGIKEGEVVAKIADEQILTADQFVQLVGQHKGEAMSLYLSTPNPDGTASDVSRQLTVVPRVNPPEGQGALGVAVVTSPIMIYEKQPWYKAPWVGLTQGSYESYLWAREMVRIFSHPKELFSQMSGPVAVVRVGAEAVSAGWVTTLRFVGILSINLAVFNLLPLPALDGGRLLFVGIGLVVGRKRVARVEAYANTIGMGLLILLLIGVTVKDVFFR